MTAPPSMSHSRAFELLPWLVNGTLGAPERDAVEEHVRTCIVCRREIKEQQRLHTTVRARRTADVSAEAGFDRMNRELDDAARTRQAWSKRSAALAPFAVAAAAGLAALAILLWLTPLPGLENNAYSTLATPAASNAVLLDVVFAEDTTAAEMQALLDDIGGEIVAGPSDVGRYNVRIAVDRPGEARSSEVLGLLATDRRVRFAGRSLTDLPR
jgi:anti-sigma factor RsiW